MTQTTEIDVATENPYLTIWMRPRATIRGIVNQNPSFRVLPIAIAGGILQAIQLEVLFWAGDQLSVSMLLVLCVVLGPLLGLILLYLGAWIVELSCRMLGGQSDSAEVRAALAWSSIPFLATTPLWIIRFASRWQGTFYFREAKSSVTTGRGLSSGRDRRARGRVVDLVAGDHGQGARRGPAILGLESAGLDALAPCAVRRSDCDRGGRCFFSPQESAHLNQYEKRPVMSELSNLAAELEFAKALAGEAALVAMQRSGDVTPQEKANLSYVTDLDNDLERLIRERLGGAVSRRRADRRGVRRGRRAAGRGDGRSTRSTAPATWSTACRSGPSASA